MSFLRKGAEHSLRDRVRSSDIRRELGIEPRLLRIERSQLRWFGHLIRMPPECLLFRGFPGTSNSENTPGRPRTRLRDYISQLENVVGEREVWVNLLGLLGLRPDENAWMDGSMRSGEILTRT